jgi:STE24 endopeptidase
MPDELPLSESSDRANAAEMTAEQLAEAKQYGRYELYCALADKALDLIYLTVAAVLLAGPIDRWLQGFILLGRNWSLRLAAMFVIVTALHVAVSFPLSFYSGHVLEHRFHLSTLSTTGWLWRYVKRQSLAGLLGMAMVLGLYWLIWTTGGWWWLVAAGAFFAVSVLLGQLAPVLILPLFYKIERLENSELSARMARLADGTGLSIEGVYRMALSAETVKANAMLAGLGRTRRVLMGDTLLDNFTPDEIEVIFAHEIGHHVFRHIHKLILAGLLTSTGGFWLCDRILTLGAADRAGFDYAALPVAMLPWIMLILSVFSLLIEPLGNFVSRRFERQSDRYALARTRNPEAYISAFRKLAKLNKDDPSPHWLEVLLFHSHPPIAERIGIADAIGTNG